MGNALTACLAVQPPVCVKCGKEGSPKERHRFKVTVEGSICSLCAVAKHYRDNWAPSQSRRRAVVPTSSHVLGTALPASQSTSLSSSRSSSNDSSRHASQDGSRRGGKGLLTAALAGAHEPAAGAARVASAPLPPTPQHSPSLPAPSSTSDSTSLCEDPSVRSVRSMQQCGSEGGGASVGYGPEQMRRPRPASGSGGGSSCEGTAGTGALRRVGSSGAVGQGASRAGTRPPHWPGSDATWHGGAAAGRVRQSWSSGDATWHEGARGAARMRRAASGGGTWHGGTAYASSVHGPADPEPLASQLSDAVASLQAEYSLRAAAVRPGGAGSAPQQVPPGPPARARPASGRGGAAQPAGAPPLSSSLEAWMGGYAFKHSLLAGSSSRRRR